MPSRDEYDKTLAKLEALLRRKAMTAKAIAEALRCCRPVAYQRLRALEARGLNVVVEPARDAGKPGPKAVAFRIR
jgi:predicted ArsR family transcriptional regulator